MESSEPSEERHARSLALEKAYVHDVYDQIAPHFSDTRYRPWPRVKQFLLELEPGSLVADVGCGNGKYLDINPDLMKIGLDHCSALTAASRAKNFEVMTCDNLSMPFRDETFDAVLSVAVIHHFATTDRRVAAIKELTRLLRIGGKVLITVWAMEQRHRKFDSQDVLVPWHEPVKSSSEDHASSVEREVTSTTTSDDDILVYHAYSHVSDNEHSKHHPSAINRKRQKCRNGRGRYRSADSAFQCRRAAGNSSQSSSELSSPNETCYSFVRRAFQKFSNSSSSGDFSTDSSVKRLATKPSFYRSCRKPCFSESMEFGKLNRDSDLSPKNELSPQESIDSECPDPTNENDVPIELRGLEGYDTCKKCGSPTADFSYSNCEQHVCTSCLPIDPDTGKKSRSLGDFFNMIPKLLRVKKCEKEPISDLHKRISTASDPREYVVKTRGGDLNGIVRSKSTVSLMSRLEELMAMSPTNDKEGVETVANPNCPAGPRSKVKQSLLQSFTSTLLVENSNGVIEIREPTKIPENARRYNSPADALKKLRQDVSLDEVDVEKTDFSKNKESEEKKLKNCDFEDVKKQIKQSSETNTKPTNSETLCLNGTMSPDTEDASDLKAENDAEGRLSSYFSMPELYKLAYNGTPEEPEMYSQKEKHISFYEQAQSIIFADCSSESNDLNSGETDCPLNFTARGRKASICSQRGLVKRSLSVDTGDHSSSSHHTPRRFSASAAQGVLASSLRTYSIPRSCSRGSSVKSDTSVDSEESIVSVIPRKGNSITSDTSVDSEESVISVIQRSTSDIDTLGCQNGFRNISRFGSRSAQASPITVLSSQTSSAESSPPQSGKSEGRFPGSVGVIDQLMQQQLLYSAPDAQLIRGQIEAFENSLRSRRSLLRPISDAKIEDELTTNCLDELLSDHANTKSINLMHNFKSNNTNVISEIKDVNKRKIVKQNSMPNPSVKPLISDFSNKLVFKDQKSTDSDGELSRTPSPIGPFQYITDPLITGIEPSCVSSVAQTSSPASNTEAESKLKTLRFNSEVTSLEDNTVKTLSQIGKPLNGIIGSALRNKNFKKESSSSAKNVELGTVLTSTNDPVNGKDDPNPLTEKSPKEVFEFKQSVCDSINASSSIESHKSKHQDNDMKKSFFKLRERLENLASSQNSFQTSFEIFKNVGHTFGSLRNTKEKIESDSPGDSPRECRVSPTPKSLNDSRQSSLDESSQMTLSDESVMSVEGTTSASDENDYKKTDEEDDNLDSSQNITVRKVEDMNGLSSGCVNAAAENRHSSHLSVKICDSCSEKNVCPSNFTPKSSLIDTDPQIKRRMKCSLRKRLKRSCITIDEIECREFVSSEDTSPSSSVSMEWNDFDKKETDTSTCAVCCGATAAITESSMQREGPPIEICCNDVNVAETETKFNIIDKEMCVFFETPPSSIGKSASSSSNATDFSTTSDRFRGIIQREKSDDRSSKESDSDNLSKLSDLEARSESVFSEDIARRSEFLSSSSTSSDALESVRTKLCNEPNDGDGTSCKAKLTSNWVLDNIDEIPDDDNDETRSGCEIEPSVSLSSSASWKKEKSMDFDQRRENFLSCAADCRDMYRISFDDTVSSKTIDKSVIENNTSNVSAEERPPLYTIGMSLPELAPGFLELFPPTRRSEDENDAPTDILAAFVETISDITSAFGELYPRQEVKIEDASSDESVGISTFERVLTSSSVQAHIKNRAKKLSESQSGKSDKRLSEETNTNESENTSIQNSGKQPESEKKDDLKHLGPTFVKLPPENAAHLKSEISLEDKCPNTPSLLKNNLPTSNPETSPPQNISSTNSPAKKIPERLLMLNRTSQSVCLDRIRQSSFEKEDEPSTQSAPCSPRMKPRQRSVEEVLSSSRNELSRNSSLSQSTSQESLPGADVGGLMSYHRYYHVFRQGELDNLIETHVDNLHILSSYYDHANWCIVAEKVQVWTI